MTGKRRVRDWQATDPHLRRSPYFEDFAERLGAPVIVADGLLSGLWRFAFCFAQDGDIGKFTPAQIARAVGWEGDPDVMWEALTASKFVEDKNRLHHWEEWGGRLFEQRKADSERKWDKRKAPQQEKESTEVQGTCRMSMGQSGISPRGTERGTGTEREDQEPSAAKRPAAPPKVSALKVDDWAERAAELLEQSSYPSDLMQLADLMAAENRSGKVSMGRVVRELYSPLVEMQGEFSEEAMRYGLRAAITSSAPNANYVKKAAAKFKPNGGNNGQRSGRAVDSAFGAIGAVYRELEEE